jgi:hypothetical protein
MEEEEDAGDVDSLEFEIIFRVAEEDEEEEKLLSNEEWVSFLVVFVVLSMTNDFCLYK